ncbi:SGNH/GDSL hydrolase family protein [Sulfitobacter sp. HNIBRBA3233]|uniref:SGNH/GDSL hydrolase family protein n=1 Tax=Sulfitobacter marinivivus TaxID=3158558 RepID=UPI0032DFFB97
MVETAKHLRRVIRDTTFAALLSPVLIWQAVGLRRRALKLPEAIGPRHGTSGTGMPLRLLIVGDSSAAGVGASHQSEALAGQLALALSDRHHVQWTLIARTGITTNGMLRALDAYALPPSDIAVIVLGVNDVTHGAPLRRWLKDHEALRGQLRDRAGVRRTYVAQVPPLGAFPLLPAPLRTVLGRRADRFDAALRLMLDRTPDATYIALPETLDPADMASDGFHPGPAIYATWAKDLARRILSDGPEG